MILFTGSYSSSYLQNRLSGCPPGALGALLPPIGLMAGHVVRNDNYRWRVDQAVSSDDLGLRVNARHHSLPDAQVPVRKSPLKGKSETQID